MKRIFRRLFKHEGSKEPLSTGGSGLTAKVNRTLLAQVFAHMMVSQVAAGICATVLLVGLYNRFNNFVLLSWYISFVAIIFLRLYSAHLFKGVRESAKAYKTWRTVFTVSAGVGGIMWGFVGIGLFPYLHAPQQTLCVLILAGITAGSVPILSAIIEAEVLYVSLALVPLIVRIYFLDNPIYTLFDITLVAYLIYLIIISVKTCRVIREAMCLKFENQELVKKFEVLATLDPLTNIDNSRLFNVNLEKELKRADRDDHLLALLYIDLDKFKEANDSFGHEVGDKVLIDVANKLKNAVRATDHVARLGGDEFAVILTKLTDTDVARKVAKKICELLSKPIQAKGHIINISSSIGVSIYPTDAKDAESLLKSADDAMYYTKEHGKNNFHFFGAGIK